MCARWIRHALQGVSNRGIELSVITYEIASVQQTHYPLFRLFSLKEGGCSRFLM